MHELCRSYEFVRRVPISTRTRAVHLSSANMRSWQVTLLLSWVAGGFDVVVKC
jgi:hypothetical protein